MLTESDSPCRIRPESPVRGSGEPRVGTSENPSLLGWVSHRHHTMQGTFTVKCREEHNA